MAGIETIGERLKRLRLERKLSQRDLSQPGVSYAYISRVEAGASNPSVKALRLLAGELGVTAEYLEFGETAGKPVDEGLLSRALGDLSPTPEELDFCRLIILAQRMLRERAT